MGKLSQDEAMISFWSVLHLPPRIWEKIGPHVPKIAANLTMEEKEILISRIDSYIDAAETWKKALSE